MPTVANSIIPSIIGSDGNNFNDKTVDGVLNNTNVPTLSNAYTYNNQVQITTLTQCQNGLDTSDIVVSKVTGNVYKLADLAKQFGETSTEFLATKIISQDGLWHNYKLIKKGETVTP